MVTSFAFTCCDKIINGLVVVIYHYHELDHHPHQPRKHRNMGCFPFNQKVWFEFWQASAWNSIFQNFQKEGNLVRYTQISETYSQKYFSFNVASWISIVTVFIWMVCISEIQHFWEFWEISVPFCHCFQIFESFGWMESTHQPIG